MRLDELLASLPNGLHDAELRQMTVDWARRAATFELSLWTARLDDPRGSEVYRPARITFGGVEALSIQVPQQAYGAALGNRSGLWIDGDLGHPEQAGEVGVPCSSQANRLWIFVHDWNAFVLLAAASAELVWTGPDQVCA